MPACTRICYKPLSCTPLRPPTPATFTAYGQQAPQGASHPTCSCILASSIRPRLPDEHGGTGVAESWAAGASWAEVMLDCVSADDGDIGRLLSRVADLLEQASHCLGLPTELRSTARQAAKTMSRAPIADYL